MEQWKEWEAEKAEQVKQWKEWEAEKAEMKRVEEERVLRVFLILTLKQLKLKATFIDIDNLKVICYIDFTLIYFRLRLSQPILTLPYNLTLMIWFPLL